MRQIWVFLLCGALVGCHHPTNRKPTRYEIDGTPQERVAKASAILIKYCRLPGPILDAHMAEDVFDNSGGLVPGPSDSSLSGVIYFPAEDLPKWRAMLAPPLPPDLSLRLDGPNPLPLWWPATKIKGGEFYPPEKLTGRKGGLVMLSPAASAIYFYVF